MSAVKERIFEEESPDEWDLQMLQEIAENPDCREFLSAEDALKELGLQH